MPYRNFFILLVSLFLAVLFYGFSLEDRILIETLHRVEREAVARPSRQQLYEGAMDGLLKTLGGLNDPYSMFIPHQEQREYNDEMNNRYDGIGVVFRPNPQGLLVDYPVLHSPAYNAGLRSGDRILKINGTETKKRSREKTDALLRESGDSVELTILSYGETVSKEITVLRKHIQRFSVFGDRIEDGKCVFFLQTEPDIAYIRLTSFTDTSLIEMVNALMEAEKNAAAKGLILDLRSNPGGYVDVCIDIAKLFLSPNKENGVIVSVCDRDGTRRNTEKIGDSEPFCRNLKMLVLLDGDAASASEILAAALQDHKRAEIVGSRSYGKGVMQRSYELPFNYGQYQLTNQEYRRPNGARITRNLDGQSGGVVPDAEIKCSPEQERAVYVLRDIRSQLVSDHWEEVYQDVIQEFPKREKKTFALPGNAPYYDPALEEAVKRLR